MWISFSKDFYEPCSQHVSQIPKFKTFKVYWWLNLISVHLSLGLAGLKNYYFLSPFVVFHDTSETNVIGTANMFFQFSLAFLNVYVARLYKVSMFRFTKNFTLTKIREQMWLWYYNKFKVVDTMNAKIPYFVYSFGKCVEINLDKYDMPVGLFC